MSATTSSCRPSVEANEQRASAMGNDGGSPVSAASAASPWPVSRSEWDSARNTPSSLKRTGTSTRSATDTRVTTRVRYAEA